MIMADQEAHAEAPKPPEEGNTATKTRQKPEPTKTTPKQLPQYKVLLHNDDVNEFGYVIATIIELTPIKRLEAIQKTFEADRKGLSLLLVTHKERAELYQEQFKSKRLTVTIEPA